MNLFRDMLNKIRKARTAQQTATDVEMDITVSIGKLTDRMFADDVPYLDRIAMLNKHLEDEIVRFNAIPGITETERWASIARLREYVRDHNRQYRELQLLASRK